MDVQTWTDRGRAIVEIAGELDAATAPRLREELARVSAPAPRSCGSTNRHGNARPGNAR
jgi:anti-anti-sigma regulatory factor